MTPKEKIDLAMQYLVANVGDAKTTGDLAALNLEQPGLGSTRGVAERHRMGPKPNEPVTGMAL